MAVSKSRLKMLAGLEKRLITALILGLVVIGASVSGSITIFSLLMALFVGFGAWEWLALSQVSGAPGKVLYPACMLLCIFAFYIFHAPGWDIYFILGGVIIWCVAFVMVLEYQQGRSLIPNQPMVRLIIGLLILVSAWVNLFILYSADRGMERVLLLFLLIWLVDSSAYFVGSYLGRRRLASKVSPGKSWEGFWGAMAAAILLAVIYSWFTGINETRNQFWLVILFMVTTVFSVIGDLFISMFKRSVHLKDTSSLLPGHGGVLDRVDSLLSAAPVFVCGFRILGDKL